MLQLLAQLPEQATPNTIVGAFIAVALALSALVGWVVRHVFVTTIPESTKVTLAVAENFKEAIKTIAASSDTNQAGMRADNQALRAQHDANLGRVLAAVQAEGAAERRLCQEQFTSLNAAIIGLTSTIREEREAIVAAVNHHTTEACAAYRHDLYDKLNEAVMGKAAERWRDQGRGEQA
jgi:hypothetical protein